MARSKSAGQIAKESAAAVEEQMRSRGIVEAETYGDLGRGDPLGIVGETGTFKFQSVRLDSDGNPVYVNVYGGPAGSEAFRSFTLTRITAKPRKSRRVRKGDVK